MADTFGGAGRTDSYEEGSPGDAFDGPRRMDVDDFEKAMEQSEPKPVQPPKRLLGSKRAQEQYERDLRQWAHRDAERVMRGGGWSKPKNVMVVNTKGSSGKTPTVLGLAGALGKARPGQVAALEVGESAGSLLNRAEGDTKAGLADLLDNLANLTTRSAIDAFGLIQSSGATVFGSPVRRAPFSASDVATIRDVLDRYYPVTISDSANNEMAPGFAEALKRTDALVVPTTLSMDSARAVVNILDFIERKDPRIPHRPELWARTTVIITKDGRQDDPELAANFAKLMRKSELRVVEVPFDEHIAEGRTIVYDKLAESTKAAFREAAKAVAEGFNLAEAQSN